MLCSRSGIPVWLSIIIRQKKKSNSQIACLFFSFVFSSQKISLHKDTYVTEIDRAERITSNLPICNLGFSITGEFVLNKHFFPFNQENAYHTNQN